MRVSSSLSITVNGRFLSQAITGVQRYALEMLTALDNLLYTGQVERILVTVLAPPNATVQPLWRFIRLIRVGRSVGHLWEQMDLPRHTRGQLLFTPCGGAPLVHSPHVITIHDAGPFATPGSYTWAYRTYYKSMQRILASSARHILTVSEFSKQEIIRFLGVSGDKITPTWLSGEHILRYPPDDAVLQQHSIRAHHYVLAVGSQNPNKNLHHFILASACLTSPVAFVIAGGGNRNIFSMTPSSSSQVRRLGFVNDSALRTLYENASCFVFPSSYEGFGLPPLEALTLGCPIVVARAASLPEVFGTSAIYCDPHSPSDIARCISRVLNDEHPDRESMMAHASRFSWERCARETWAVLLNSV